MSSVLGLDAYSPAALAFLAASALIAGLARGFSGFGAALIFVPLASTQVNPSVAAPVLLIADIVAAASLVPNAWRMSDKRDVGTVLIGTLVGVPLGTWVLARSDPVAIRWAIAMLIFPLLALLMSGWRYTGKPARPFAIGAGSLSGFFNGLAQVGGPPIIVYWLGSRSLPKIVRANIVLYFAATAAITFASYFAAGIITAGTFGLAVAIGPLYGLGLYVGSRMFGIANEAIFRYVCYALIAAAGIISLPVLDGILR
jgi:uncharacterized membrane protein YfcA